MDKWKTVVLVALLAFATVVFLVMIITAGWQSQVQEFKRVEKGDGIVILNLRPGEVVYAVCRDVIEFGRVSYCLPMNNNISVVDFGGYDLIVVFIMKNGTLTEISALGEKLVINHP